MSLKHHSKLVGPKRLTDPDTIARIIMSLEIKERQSATA
jgi:hypothetical protein